MDSFTLEKIEFDAVREILAAFCATSAGKALARLVPVFMPDQGPYDEFTELRRV